MAGKSIIVATANTTQRNNISALVDAIPDFVVIARTGDLMNTYNQVEARLPTAVLISDSLAQLPEFEVMRALFSALDVRWLVLTAPNKSHRSPVNTDPGSDLFSVPGNASAKVIEGQLRSLTRSGPQRLNSAQKSRLTSKNVSPTISKKIFSNSVSNLDAGRKFSSISTPKEDTKFDSLILIGASTGGVDALLKVLSTFPADCPPTLIVQHTGAGFGVSLAGLLNRQCAPEISLVEGESLLKRGNILIGAGNKSHLVLKDATCLTATLKKGSQVSGHLPSVDMLFQSAIGQAHKVTAAILTGMGKDGAEGLLALRSAGATTFAQDEASSVVYGMPRAAVENGAAQQVLSLEEIGPALLKGPNRHGNQLRKVHS
ncbi:MAG: CheB methylesterase domain-containing protein [Pelagimonas sp.]|uniref:CheB methylesterase domain-containing protein n=1 Tax=Pelagimonas sp. TaxID=2073170 RepID=UPI003D6C0AAF